jgi:hypothetical protein
LHINFDSVTALTGTQRRSKSDRSVRCAIERGSEDDTKLGEGTEETVPLSKLNETETGSTVMLRSLRINLQAYGVHQWLD